MFWPFARRQSDKGSRGPLDGNVGVVRGGACDIEMPSDSGSGAAHRPSGSVTERMGSRRGSLAGGPRRTRDDSEAGGDAEQGGGQGWWQQQQQQQLPPPTAAPRAPAPLPRAPQPAQGRPARPQLPPMQYAFDPKQYRTGAEQQYNTQAKQPPQFTPQPPPQQQQPDRPGAPPQPPSPTRKLQLPSAPDPEALALHLDLADASVLVYRTKPSPGHDPKQYNRQASPTPHYWAQQQQQQQQAAAAAAAPAADHTPLYPPLPPPPRALAPTRLPPNTVALNILAPQLQPPGPEPGPCPLRPCPPSSVSGMRVESFTSGTGGKAGLLRPGVGIGAGTMREARYEDLRLIQQIGQGGFGKVYYGHWCGSPVAIKMASPRAGSSEQQLLEFQREVTNMATLPPHANVLKLLGACMEPQHLALITQFCSRGSLYSMLHAPGAVRPLPQQLLTMWLGVARGMQHLHACRVLHRDLKSANLLIDDMGCIKICDFGLSRMCGADGHTVQPALTGGLGTYQWMAPEVLTSQRYSEKADVYSFGIVMWESLALELPFEGMTAMQAALSVATQGMRPAIPPGTDPAHAQLMRECWAPVADQRPGFGQIVQRLEAMAAQAPSGRGAPSAPAGPAPARGGSVWGRGQGRGGGEDAGVEQGGAGNGQQGQGQVLVTPPRAPRLGGPLVDAELCGGAVGGQRWTAPSPGEEGHGRVQMLVGPRPVALQRRVTLGGGR